MQRRLWQRHWRDEGGRSGAERSPGGVRGREPQLAVNLAGRSVPRCQHQGHPRGGCQTRGTRRWRCTTAEMRHSSIDVPRRVAAEHFVEVLGECGRGQVLGKPRHNPRGPRANNARLMPVAGCGACRADGHREREVHGNDACPVLACHAHPYRPLCRRHVRPINHRNDALALERTRSSHLTASKKAHVRLRV